MRTNRKVTYAAAVVSTGLVAAFGAAEGALRLAAPTVVVNGGYDFRSCWVAGYRPRPGVRGHVYVHDGRTIYDVTYTCDEHGRRVTPPGAGAPVVWFGDSMVFGEGIQDREASPWVLGEITGRPTVNCSASGWNPAVWLSILESGELDGIDPPELVVVAALSHHVARAAGEARWRQGLPCYELDDGGRLFRDGWYGDNRPPMLGWSLLAARFAVDREPPARDVVRWAAIVDRIRGESRRRWPRARVVVVFYRVQGDPREREVTAIAALRAAGLDVVDFSDVLRCVPPAERVLSAADPLESHPSPRAARLVAEHLATMVGSTAGRTE